jgi:hypothetical protein
MKVALGGFCAQKSYKLYWARIQIAGIEVEVFQLPDGEYVMSQSQCGKAVEVHKFSMSRFLNEKWLEGKLYKDYRNYKIPSVNDSIGRGGNNNPIKIIPIDLASEFWFEQAIKGNIKAQALAQACLKETLRRRCDKEFGQVKSEDEYEQKATSDRQTWGDARGYCSSEVKRNLSECCI